MSQVLPLCHLRYHTDGNTRDGNTSDKKSLKIHEHSLKKTRKKVLAPLKVDQRMTLGCKTNTMASSVYEQNNPVLREWRYLLTYPTSQTSQTPVSVHGA